MKYLKQFEIISKRNNNLLINKPEVGDLVVGFITARKGWDVELKYFLNNTVGEVSESTDRYYRIAYRNVPENLVQNFVKFEDTDGHYERSIIKSDVRFAEPREKREFLLKKQRDKYNI